jgi:polyisoprenoid-binding protein YceI
LLALLLVTTRSRSSAQQQVVQFDPATTKIDFTLGASLHTVHGTFHLKSGEIRFDPATGAASGALVVDAASGNSGNDKRDTKMKREVLETDRYPDIVFSPTHVSGILPAQGEKTLNVEGVFRIHGADHNMTLSVPVLVSKDSVQIQTELFVPYIAWGMKNPSTFLLHVSEQVKINVAGSVQITAASQAASGK